MCYRCSVCNVKVGPKVGLLRHIIYRVLAKVVWPPPSAERKEIAKEMPVCRNCKASLDDGFSVAQIRFVLCPPAPKPTALEAEAIL